MMQRMKGTLRPGRKAGVLALAVLLLTCVLMAGAVSAVENNYYQVPDCGWDTTHNITAEIPSASGTWVNFTDLISAITYARSNVSTGEEAVFYCKPGAVIYGAIPPTSAVNHLPVNFSFTIYGNGASVAHSINSPTAEFDFSIDTYEPILISNIDLTVYNLTNVSFWGERSTEHTLNLLIDGCTLEGEGYPRIYLTGATGSNNIQIQNTKFLNGPNSVVYSNAPGEISLKDCVFTNNQVPVNINHKATSGTLKVTIENCSFTNCGKGNSSIEELYSAPIRVVNSQNENTAVSVEIIGCSFDNPKSSNGDILLGEGREGKTSKGVIATITDLKTDANLQVQNPGDRTTTGSTGYELDLSKGTNYAVSHTGSGEPQVVIILPPEPEPQPSPSYISSDGNMENAYRVLFNDGSTTLSVVTDLSSGDKLTKPETPVKDGYTFAGWYKDSACTQAWDFETGIPGDMTLYAKWTASGETEATATPTKTQTAVTTPQPTKTQTAAATTSAPEATTAIAVSPTLTQAPAPAAGALFGLLAAGLLLRRRN